MLTEVLRQCTVCARLHPSRAVSAHHDHHPRPRHAGAALLHQLHQIERSVAWRRLQGQPDADLRIEAARLAVALQEARQ